MSTSNTLTAPALQEQPAAVKQAPAYSDYDAAIAAIYAETEADFARLLRFPDNDTKH